MTDVRARARHPESNGLDERVHRTMRQEMPIDHDTTFYQAQQVIVAYRTEYNEHRPHSALRYLCPREFYRGDPQAALAARADACRAAVSLTSGWAKHLFAFPKQTDGSSPTVTANRHSIPWNCWIDL